MNAIEIFSFNLNYTVDVDLSKKLLPVVKNILQDNTKLTNEWNYKNTYSDGPGLADDPSLSFFVDLILEKSYSFIKKNYKNFNKKLWVSLFASEMHKGDFHGAHRHPGALLSGILYLQVPENSAKLEFRSPKCEDPIWTLVDSKFNNSESFLKENKSKTIVVDPEEGLFLLWESWITHRVSTHNSDTPRITLVFNVGIQDE